MGSFITLVFLAVTVWIYFDSKKLRNRGIDIYPWVITGIFFLGNVVLSFVAGFVLTFYTESNRTLDAIVGVVVLAISLAWYALLRMKWQKNMTTIAQAAPLPRSPRWTFLVFLAAIALPLIFVGLVMLYVILLWG